MDVSDFKTPQFTENLLEDPGLFLPMQETQMDRCLERQGELSDFTLGDDSYGANVQRRPAHVTEADPYGVNVPSHVTETDPYGVNVPSHVTEADPYGVDVQRRPSQPVTDMTQCPSLHRDISNPIIYQGSGIPYRQGLPVQKGPEKEDIACKESASQPHQEKIVPGIVVSQEPSRIASFSHKDPERLERVASIMTHAQASQPHPDVDRMMPNTLQEPTRKPDQADGGTSKIAQIPPCTSYEGVEEGVSSAGQVLEMPDRIISKTMTGISDRRSEGVLPQVSVLPADRKNSNALEAPGIHEKAERIISRISHMPSAQQYAEAVMYPDSATSMPPAPKTADSTTKQLVDSKVYHEMATTAPPTRAPSQFKEISGATEGPQRVYKVPSTPYYELNSAVESPVDGIPFQSTTYLPANQDSVARIFRALSDTHTTIESKQGQGGQPSSYDAPVESRPSFHFTDHAEAASMQFGPPPQGPPVQYKPESVQQEGTVPCDREQVPRESLVPSQKGKTHSVESVKQPASQHSYQTVQSPPLQQPVYRNTDTGDYHALYHQEATNIPQQANDSCFKDDARYYITSEPFEKRRDETRSSMDESQKHLKDQCERDQANMWTLYRLTDLSQQKGYSAQPVMGNTPAYKISDEAKMEATAPYILVGFSVQDTHGSQSIPGHSVLSNNEISTQRRYIAIPVAVAVPREGHDRAACEETPPRPENHK
ncbi:uncharacterized protein LOC142486886 isoform X2 [Ascaphus truei]